MTLAKVTLKSRRPGPSLRRERGGTLIVMGNGPSLRDTIANHLGFLSTHETMAVNFAANTPEFFSLRPRHYVLADPHFFTGEEKDPNVKRLWENLARADWDMTLHLPVGLHRQLPENISIQHFNMTPGDGSDWLSRRLYRSALAMPRPRNVLIPAIMEGVRDGYEDIVIVGADHTWPHSIYVDDKNRVVSVQPHFYEDNEKELDRVAREYEGLHIHDVLGSMTVAFRSYHLIRSYADSLGVSISNATPGSLIDAFPRRSLS